jgi:predicted ester cyclase
VTDVVIYGDVTDVFRRYVDALYLGIGSLDDVLADPVHLVDVDEEGRETESSRGDAVAGGQMMRAAFSDAEVSIESQSASGSTVTATVCFRGTHAGLLGGLQPTFKRVEVRFTDEVFIEGGRVRSARSRSHKPGLREQLGAVANHPVPTRVLGPDSLIDGARKFLDRYDLVPHGICRVAPPGAKWSNLKGTLLGVGLGASGLDFIAGGLATGWIQSSAKQRSGLGRVVTDHMALLVHGQGVVLFETHKRRGVLVRPIFQAKYDEIAYVNVVEAMTPLLVIMWAVQGKAPARLEGHGPDAVGVFKLLESRRSGRVVSEQGASEAQQHVAATGGVTRADPLESLERLAALHAHGALSDEEFETQKQRFLGML